MEVFTLPETNSQLAPQNGWLEYFPFPFGAFPAYFRGGQLLVSGSVICCLLDFRYPFGCYYSTAVTIVDHDYISYRTM